MTAYFSPYQRLIKRNKINLSVIKTYFLSQVIFNGAQQIKLKGLTAATMSRATKK